MLPLQAVAAAVLGSALFSAVLATPVPPGRRGGNGSGQMAWRPKQTGTKAGTGAGAGGSGGAGALASGGGNNGYAAPPTSYPGYTPGYVKDPSKIGKPPAINQ